MELFRLAKDVLNRKYNPIEYPATLLGGVVVNNEQELDTFLLHTTWFTYRTGFRQFARSDCTSDKGWGCLIRTCQMMVARALTLHGQLDLAWFKDTNDDACPFSIHKFIRWVKNPHEAFDTKFWTPAQGCEAIRNTIIELGHMHMLTRPLTSYVCSDSTIVVEDVQFRLDDGMSVLILLPTVTGLQRTITQGTYFCLEQLLQIPHCCGIVAGVPNRSYFIIGVSGQRFCFLDPHTTQPAFTNESNLGNYYESGATLPAVAWNRIDSSILLGFYISSHSEWDSFVDRLADVKRRSGGVELFSIATKAMLKGGPNARKPASQHLYLRRKLKAEEGTTATPQPAAGTPTNGGGGGGSERPILTSGSSRNNANHVAQSSTTSPTANASASTAAGSGGGAAGTPATPIRTTPGFEGAINGGGAANNSDTSTPTATSFLVAPSPTANSRQSNNTISAVGTPPMADNTALREAAAATANSPSATIDDTNPPTNCTSANSSNDVNNLVLEQQMPSNANVDESNNTTTAAVATAGNGAAMEVQMLTVSERTNASSSAATTDGGNTTSRGRKKSQRRSPSQPQHQGSDVSNHSIGGYSSWDDADC